MIRLLLIVLLIGTQAQAGPWLRDTGRVFTATGLTLSRPLTGGAVRHVTTFYSEWGVSERLTIGLDGWSAPGQSFAGVFFSRLPLWRGAGGDLWAAEFGTGQHIDATGSRLIVRPGLSWGRGLTTKVGAGWLSTDARLTLSPGAGLLGGKIESTYGVALRPGLSLMAQLTLEQTRGGRVHWTATPSVVLRLDSARRLQLSGFGQSFGGGTAGVKIVIWQEF
ncbi:hypothetical protein SAMN04490248_101114 [Salinihabitans flavidus]|uniref:Cellulose biosynthesis protein BcsS n=1 Tax=Salinihabitans flavidus TaxID=569882 RepID=A0A1H8LER5_9RHOB|nr:hypothetical protein [Salinihabitans flavidus]SEO03650.1 hypothetical protein SAMN04490248_101114 [Salinihabitans flavidus]